MYLRTHRRAPSARPLTIPPRRLQYAFPWSPVRLLPFGSTAESHDFHHARGINAVFTSQFSVLDTVLDTLGGFPEWRRRRTLAAGARNGGLAAVR